MKHLIKTLLLSALLCMPAAIFAQRKPQLSLGTDLVSKYIWRGEEDGSAAIQPYVNVSWRGFKFETWGSFGLINNPGTDWATNEIELSLEYKFKGLRLALEDE